MFGIIFACVSCLVLSCQGGWQQRLAGECAFEMVNRRSVQSTRVELGKVGQIEKMEQRQVVKN